MKQLLLCTLIIGCWSCNVSNNKPAITVLAAASVQAVINELAGQYMDSLQVVIQVSYASSGMLARQIANGAPCDIYVSANSEWMHYLRKKKLIADASLCVPANNSLVVVIADTAISCSNLKDLPKAVKRHLAIGDPDHVPAGNYARQAFEKLNIYDDLAGKMIPAKDVLSALQLVEMGECDYGIVYASNIEGRSKVNAILTIPDSLHNSIDYQLALTATSSKSAVGFWEYIRHTNNREVWKKYGFK
ncbi:molybdate ABC transporter substrate-binding protein [Carboxylicivirga sp. A043]|uniref:molybdate ABC transporter substrate-binding protein n=1 Tax=Carboxylicivirga litoralis TaxID=2816963 RepID=UPI0021CB33ED|nr:molybdate ABC transporter substrate-binding protein [Carboxylicivirga sp. A043]MCU4157135.1 molybdate ABC transporter substrate-binding protein [Carboxylicivirga sp. A043]